jgi:hypothetical protein
VCSRWEARDTTCTNRTLAGSSVLHKALAAVPNVEELCSASKGTSNDLHRSGAPTSDHHIAGEYVLTGVSPHDSICFTQQSPFAQGAVSKSPTHWEEAHSV